MRRHPRLHQYRPSDLKAALFQAGLDALQSKSWRIEKVPGWAPSQRRVQRGFVPSVATIRTSQNRWLGDSEGLWLTLHGSDVVVVSCVDDRKHPEYSLVYVFGAKDIRARLDRAYEARKKAGATIRPGTPVWISLFDEESNENVEYVGAGAGNEEDPIAEITLTNYLKQQAQSPTQPTQSREQMILAAAKQGLALSLGVSEDDILITIRTPRSDF